MKAAKSGRNTCYVSISCRIKLPEVCVVVFRRVKFSQTTCFLFPGVCLPAHLETATSPVFLHLPPHNDAMLTDYQRRAQRKQKKLEKKSSSGPSRRHFELNIPLEKLKNTAATYTNSFTETFHSGASAHHVHKRSKRLFLLWTPAPSDGIITSTER